MLKEEFFISQVSAGCGLDFDAAFRLWQEFTEQIALRVGRGEEVVTKAFGVFYRELLPEHIVAVGEAFFFCPPRVILRLRKKLSGEPATDLVPALMFATHMTEEVVLRFFESLERVVPTLLEKAKELEAPMLGSFNLTDAEVHFSPRGAVGEQLNKPFAAFPEAVEIPREALDEAVKCWNKVELDGYLISVITEGDPVVKIEPCEEKPKAEPDSAMPDVESPSEGELHEVSPETEQLSEEVQASLPCEAVQPNEPERDAEPTEVEPAEPAAAEEVPSDEGVEAEVAARLASVRDGLEAAVSEDAPMNGGAPRLTKKEKNAVSKMKYAIAIVVLLVVGGVVGYFLANNQFLSSKAHEWRESAVRTSNNSKSKQPSGSAQGVMPLTVVPPKRLPHMAESAKPQRANAEQARTLLPSASSASCGTPMAQEYPSAPIQSCEAPKPEVHTIKTGDQLFRIAKKRYGDKVFWVYIYQENKGKIKDPDNIPIGTVLVLPPNEKYKIDAKSNISRKKALELQSMILSHRK